MRQLNCFSLLILCFVNSDPLAKSIDIYQQQVNSQYVATNTAERNKLIAVVTKRMAKSAQPKQSKPAQLDISPFHVRPTSVTGEQQKHSAVSQNFCLNCHEVKAHQKSARLRSFLNMHAKQIACQSCHFNPKDQAIDYQWQSHSGELAAVIDFSDKADYLLVGVVNNHSMVSPKDSDFATNIMTKWQQHQEQQQFGQQAQLWYKLHQVLDDKPSPCISCHQQTNPKFDLEKLGANPERKKNFESNIIARFFKRFSQDNDQINLIELLK